MQKTQPNTGPPHCHRGSNITIEDTQISDIDIQEEQSTHNHTNQKKDYRSSYMWILQAQVLLVIIIQFVQLNQNETSQSFNAQLDLNTISLLKARDPRFLASIQLPNSTDDMLILNSTMTKLWQNMTASFNMLQSKVQQDFASINLTIKSQNQQIQIMSQSNYTPAIQNMNSTIHSRIEKFQQNQSLQFNNLSSYIGTLQIKFNQTSMDIKSYSQFQNVSFASLNANCNAIKNDTKHLANPAWQRSICPTANSTSSNFYYNTSDKSCIALQNDIALMNSTLKSSIGNIQTSINSIYLTQSGSFDLIKNTMSSQASIIQLQIQDVNSTIINQVNKVLTQSLESKSSIQNLIISVNKTLPQKTDLVEIKSSVNSQIALMNQSIPISMDIIELKRNITNQLTSMNRTILRQQDITELKQSLTEQFSTLNISISSQLEQIKNLATLIGNITTQQNTTLNTTAYNFTYTLPPYQPSNQTVTTDGVYMCDYSNCSLDLLLNQTMYQFTGPASFKLVYKASIDGFNMSTFFNKTWNTQPILLIMKSEFGQVFGHYSSFRWGFDRGTNPGLYPLDDEAYLFSLTKRTKLPVITGQQARGYKSGSQLDIGLSVLYQAMPILAVWSPNPYSFQAMTNPSLHDNIYNFTSAGATNQSEYLLGGYFAKITQFEAYQVQHKD